MELKFDSRTDILEAFPTRIFMFRMDGGEPLNEALKGAILAREAAGEADAGGVVGGWRSSGEFFEWQDRGIDTVKQAALGAVQAAVPQLVGGNCNMDIRLSGSASVIRYGGYEKRHLFPGSHLTLVYMVDAGEAPNDEAPESGTIEIDDPRAQAELAALPIDNVGRSMLIAPKSGQLMLFPSWLHFRSNPYFGDGERVAITIRAEIASLSRV